MNRRFLTLAIAVLAIVALVAAAVPAFGQDAVAPSFDRRASAGAIAKAKRALRTARQAQRAARGAGDRADAARAQANGAVALGDENRSQLAAVQAKLEALKKQVDGLPRPTDVVDEFPVVSASEPALVTTSLASGEYEALGGPAVQVTVPPSGLIEVWAQVAIEDEEGGAVGLFEDGQKVPGIAEPELCGDGSALIDAQGGGPGQFVSFATPPTPSLLGCASAGAPASVLLSRPPGQHTYELRYSECSCNLGGGAEFKDRVLRVAPRP